MSRMTTPMRARMAMVRVFMARTLPRSATSVPCARQDGAVDQPAPEVEVEVVQALRRAGARFAFVHGSRARGTAERTSDLDVAAWWGGDAPAPWEIRLPRSVDLLVLDGAPLELAGRVALWGRLLFDDDPPERVRWQAQTRLIYLDEQPRQEELSRVFREGRLSGR